LILKASTSDDKKWKDYMQDKGEERENTSLQAGLGGQVGGQ